MNTWLWIAQVLLALAFGFTGLLKTTQPIAELAKHMAWVSQTPVWITRSVGVVELAGALGVLLPSVTRIRPWLSPLAAAGLTVLMLSVFLFHLTRGEINFLLPPLVLGLLAGFVAWGRF